MLVSVSHTLILP